MSKNIKKLLSILSMVLCITIGLSLPVEVYASTIPEKEEPVYSSFDDVQGETEEVGNIIAELTDERTETSKEFLLDDGTRMIAEYDMPVHYQNSQGEWVEYDNSLTEANSESTPDETNNSDYSNKSSDIKVNYSKKSKENNMIKVMANDYSISWGYKNTNKVKASLISNDEELEGNDKFTALKQVTSEIIYEEIFDNVDLQCITNTLGVKENILLKNKNTPFEFTIEYKINKLKAVSVNDKLIEIRDKSNELVYSIEAPYMIDAEGKVSTKLSMAITEQKNSKLTIKLTADKDFLLSEDCQYPVTIDPTFTIGQKWQECEAAYVDDANPNTAHGSDYFVNYVGSFGSGLYRTYCKLKSLPELNKGDMVVSAYLNMALLNEKENEEFYTDMNISAYYVNESWGQNSITWNNQPSYNSQVVDYVIFNKSTKKGWYSWDITSCVKRWYNGENNNGIMFKTYDENYKYIQCASFASSNYTLSGTPRPVFQITYRNNKGLEDYWTYSSFSVGTAGTAYINDYSGNLVFVESDASTASGIAPASVQHVYNGYMANKKYDKSSPYVGHGWKLNIQQTLFTSDKHGLSGDAKTNYPYVYTDEDGTEHYFYKKTESGKTKYLDEDGLGLELTVNSSSSTERYVITDDKDNKIKFNSSGLLTSTVDANGNKITVNYSGTTITYVTDGSGNKITFEHNETSYYLKNITDLANRKTIYYYDSGKLTEIKYPNGNTVKYTYDSDGALSTITDVDGYKVMFSYTSLSSGKKVSEIKEYGSNGTAGQKITFDRTKYNTTIIKTYGADGIYNNDDDLTSTYQFDNFGRTKTVKNKANNRDLGAAVYTYTDGVLNSSAENIKQLNRVKQEYSTGSNSVNLLSNSNMETTTENDSIWKPAKWGNDANEFITEYSTSEMYFGKTSLSINVSYYEGTSRGRVYQDISNDILLPGKTYTLSGYIKTKNITNGSTNNSGAFICAESFNSDGSFTPAFSEFVTGNTNTNIDNGWQRVSVTFTVPENSSKTRINLALKQATGTAYFDGIQLEKYTVANNYNMLENAGLEKYSSNGLPTGWTDAYSTLVSSTDKVSEGHIEGNYSFRIKGEYDKIKSLYQQVNVSGSEDDTYIVSGWANAAASAKDKNDTRKFKISIMVRYSDGTYVYKTPAEFNYSVSDWQYTSATFNLSDGTSQNKTPTAIRIYLSYQKQTSYAYFDNICLIKDNAQSYTYDDDGNLISVVDNSTKKSTMEYTNSDLTKSVDAKGYAYTYTYDDNHNMTKAKSQNGVTYNYKYNNKGLATSLEVKGTNSKTLKTEASYSNGLLTSSTDTDGNVTNYSYDNKKGTLNSVTDDSGTTNYTYNSKTDQLTSVSKLNEYDDLYEVAYNYSSDSKYLTSVSHNNTSYNITYDQYGNKTDSKVGTQSLAKYTYNSNNGALVKLTYGTGQTINYSYDAFGNVYAQKYNNKTAFIWFSDRTGNVVRENDYVNNIKYNWTYDSTGRLVRQTAEKTNGTNGINNSWFTVEYGYDLNNNITRLVNKTLDRTVTSKYTYSQDNLLTKFEIGSGRNVTYTYDGLNRLTGTSMSTDTPIDTAYTYYDSNRGSSYTTNKLETETINGVTYKYIYDTLGNITDIYRQAEDGTYEQLYYYEYDLLNQLTYVSDYENKTVYMYSYDTGGNITTETVNKIGTNGTPSSTVINRYTYGDSNWTDKLTAYNGQNITYDAIGNPLSYRDGITMTWKNGRQLATLNNSDHSVSYSYDSNSVRLSKTVNGEKYTYEYLNGLLMYETRGDAKFWYSYDANGSLYNVKYTLTDGGTVYSYYYTHNSRGDIVGIYNGYGQLKAHYEYDAWGNVLSITDQNGNAITSSTHIGNLNPFRYRGYYYDTESGFYYLMSRYYDPVTHRFINADGYFQSGGDILDANTFAYCGNNPVNRIDPTGMFWKEIGDFFSKVWSGIKTWANNTFGAGSSTTATIAKTEIPVIPDPSPITVKTGTKTTQTISKHGDSSKPISVYANKDAQHPIKSSSAGININIADFTLDLSVGLDNIGVSGSLANGNTTNSFGVKLNLSEFKVGFEGSTAIQWDNTTETAYTNVSVSGWAIVSAYILVTTGQYVQSPSCAY